MNNKEFYNTLHQVFTDGRKIWDELSEQIGFVPKGKTQPCFRINGKLISSNQLFDSRYCIKMLPQQNRVIVLEHIIDLFYVLEPIWLFDV